MSESLHLTIRYEDAGDGWVTAQVAEVPAAIAIIVAAREARRFHDPVARRYRLELSQLRQAGLLRPLLPIAAFELGVAHDDPELAYPITVDPVIADSYNWSAGNTTNMADWTAFNGSNYVPRTSCWGTCATGSGLYVYAPLGSYMPAYNAGGFYYLVPHYPSTTAYISMMAYWLTYSPGSDTNVNPFLAGGIEAPSTNSWLDIKTQTASATNLFWWFNAPSNLATAQTGKAAMFELWSSSTHTMSGWRHAYLGNADVYLSDTDAPQLTNVTHSGVSIAQANWSYSNWVDKEKPGVSVTATDGGLGIQKFGVPNNYGVLTTVPPPSGSCAGTKSSPCPTSSQISLGYDAGLMPNGITITGVVAQDPLAKADSRTWVMRVDHSAPTISLSGGLTPALTDNPYAVHVDATDGDASDTSGAQWQSGVKQIKLYRDGNLVKDTGVQSCTATAGSCPLSLDYDLGSNPPSFPIHFRVEATDQLGHTQVREWDSTLTDASPSHGTPEAKALAPLGIPQAEDDYTEPTEPELDVPVGGNGTPKAGGGYTQVEPPPKPGVRGPEDPQSFAAGAVAAQDAQAPYVTIGQVSWAVIQRTKDTLPEAFNWEPYDDVIQAYQARGTTVRSIKVIDPPAELVYGGADPENPTGCLADAQNPDTGVKMCPPKPESDPYLTQFAKALAQHYGPGSAYGIPSVSFWNEPNLAEQWGAQKNDPNRQGRAERYSDRLTAFHDGVMQGQLPGHPEMEVDAGEVAAGGSFAKGNGPRQWAKFFAKYNHLKYPDQTPGANGDSNYDVLTIHAYSELPRQIPQKVYNYQNNPDDLPGVTEVGVSEFGWGLRDPNSNGGWRCVTWSGTPNSSAQATNLHNTLDKFREQDVSVNSLTWFNLMDSVKPVPPGSPCPDQVSYDASAAQAVNTFGLYRRDRDGHLSNFSTQDHARRELLDEFRAAQ